MYKIGQLKLTDSSLIIKDANESFLANTIYYMAVTTTNDDLNEISCYLTNRNDNGDPDSNTWQEVKKDYHSNVYVFIPLKEYEELYWSKTLSNDTIIQIFVVNNELDCVAEKIGIQARPASEFIINGELFRIGYNGILEIDNDIKIVSVSRVSGGDTAILDYMYKED